MNNEETKNEAQDQQPSLENAAPAVDWHLQGLVTTVTRAAPLSMGITLQMSGFLVSGLLISGAEYFKAFANDYAGGLEKAGIETDSRSLYEELAAELYPADTDLKPPHFIHLKDARIMLPNMKGIPTRGAWWRGRISEVQGFIFGQVVQD